MLANVGPNGYPIATRSVWQYISLLKLNFIADVTMVIKETNFFLETTKLLFSVNKTSAQISMVSASGTFVKSLFTSIDTIKVLSAGNFLISSANVNKSLIVNFENFSVTGLRIKFRNLASLR